MTFGLICYIALYLINWPGLLILSRTDLNFAYLLHGVVSLVTIFLLRRPLRKLCSQIQPKTPVTIPAAVLLVAGSIGLFIQLSFFQGMEVLAGTLYRGQLRTEFGAFGPLFTLIAKFILPALFALHCAQINWKSRSPSDWAPLAYHAILTFFSGLCLGAKTSALFALLPGLMLFSPFVLRHRLALIFFSLLSLSTLIFGAHQFDQRKSPEAATRYVLRRLTIVQAEPLSLIWDQLNTQNRTINYPQTLLGFPGKQTLAHFLDLPRNSPELALYDYSATVSVLLYPESKKEALEGRYNVTTTSFGEGLLALGWPGALLYSSFASFLALLSLTLHRATRNSGRRAESVLLSVAYFYVILSWLNSGGVTTLFHVVTVFCLISTWLALKILEKFFSRA